MFISMQYAFAVFYSVTTQVELYNARSLHCIIRNELAVAFNSSNSFSSAEVLPKEMSEL